MTAVKAGADELSPCGIDQSGDEDGLDIDELPKPAEPEPKRV